MSDCISRQAVHYYIESHIHEIITESGVDKNDHTNRMLRTLVNGVDTMPSVTPTDSVIEDIKAEIRKPLDEERFFDTENAKAQVKSKAQNTDTIQSTAPHLRFPCIFLYSFLILSSSTPWRIKRKVIFVKSIITKIDNPASNAYTIVQTIKIYVSYVIAFENFAPAVYVGGVSVLCS